MGIVQNIIGMVRDIHDRQRTAKVDEQLKNYLNDPSATIANITQIDPRFGIALDDQQRQRDAASLDAYNKHLGTDFGVMRDALRGLPDGTDFGAAIDNMSPYLTQQGGISPERVASFKQLVTTNPHALMDDKAYESWAKDQFTSTVGTPGSHILRGGKVIDRVPYAIKSVNTPAGARSTPFDPNTGEFGVPRTPPNAGVMSAPAAPVDGAGGIALPPGGNIPSGNPLTPPRQAPQAGGLTPEALAPVFKAQESGGDYTVVNKSTGALGAYQIMPNTGKALAAKLGMAWRPDMMRKDDPASQRYQDAIGQAAIQESIDYSGGDPATLFSHYYGGPDQSKWGPRTREYTQEMTARLGGGGGQQASVGRDGVYVPPKPAKADRTYRTASPEELRAAGYPQGTAAQVDDRGQFVNLKTPSAASYGHGEEQGWQVFQTATSAVDDLIGDIDRVANDRGLEGATGLTGKAMALIPGTHAHQIAGLIESINAQKMLSLATALKSGGGNPFSRITNMEAQQLPKTLGDFSLTQNATDLRQNLAIARKRLVDLKTRLTDGAKRTGVWQYGNGEPSPMGGGGAPAPASGGGGAAPIGTRVQTPSGIMIKTQSGWQKEGQR